MALYENTQQAMSLGRHVADVTKVRRAGPTALSVVLALAIAAGISLIAYPTLSDWWNSFHQTRAIASYVRAFSQSDPQQLAQILADARAYNARLAEGGALRLPTDAEHAEYQGLLNVDGTGVMGYVQMSCLGIRCPIYHGVDEVTLQGSLGHLEGSSLPIGGASTHAVIAGHRGLPQAKLFSDLDKAKVGDAFTVTVLGEARTYEVDQIRVVLPEDVSELAIVPGADLVTLLTCTPYGINTHRLLVRGHRVESALQQRDTAADAVQEPTYPPVLTVGVPALFIGLVVALCVSGRDDGVARKEGRHART